MGKRSREKGAQFERLICQLVRACDPLADVRRGKQSHLADEPDVVIAAGAGWLPRLWLECHHGAVSIGSKLLQAERDCGDRGVPVVIWRRTGSRAINATLRFGDLVVLGWTGGTYGELRGCHVLVTLEAGELLAIAREATPYWSAKEAA